MKVGVPRALRRILIPVVVLLCFWSGTAGAMTGLQDWLADDAGVDLYGFLEARNGWRLANDADEKDASIAEVRLQLDATRDVDWALLKVKLDILGDLVEEEAGVEPREVHVSFSPFDFMDVKAGRQTLTWGTGDLLFINDLFPKDWVSFFIGRDDEYLKSPSDAIKTSFFFDLVNVDLVYVPVFNGSLYIDGSRLSYWNGLLGRTAGRDFVFADDERNRFFTDDELALRISKNFNGVEFALYGYNGFWSTPEGVSGQGERIPDNWRLIYPKLAVYGASIRGAIWGGIGNLEPGYYESRDDHSGDNPSVRNSEIRFLAGFERELVQNLTGAFQYYLEYMQDYDAYEQALNPQSPKADEFRHLLTIRLTKLLMNQNLRISLFCYYTPSDQDAYLRPKVHYKVSDQWALEVGGNIFLGADEHTFFGQFEDNTNLFAGLRRNF